MPTVSDIIHNIYRWERGKVTPGERYRMYFCHAFGITPGRFGAPGNDSDVTPPDLFADLMTAAMGARTDGRSWSAGAERAG
jgi:hypothetical protein